MKERQSNIELLRILCMLMVMILHFNNQCANPDLLGFPNELTSQYTWGFLIECFCIVAVNCFVLISGYFGINLKVSSVLRLYLQCFFIGLLSYLLYVALTPATIEIKPLLGRLLAFTHNHWWFVISYLCLMLVSPFLNAAIENISPKKLLLCTILYGVIVIYFGWYKHLESTNSGYSFVSFVFLYLIGRYIGKYVSLEWIKRKRWSFGLGYIFGSLLLFGLVMLSYCLKLNIPSVFQYDHPLVILNASCLLLFFLGFSFNSRTVNRFASSVFAAYLLQESTYLGHRVIYPVVAKWFANTPPCWGMRLFVVCIIFLIVSVLVDKFLELVSKPILMLGDKVIRIISNKVRI